MLAQTNFGENRIPDGVTEGLHTFLDPEISGREITLSKSSLGESPDHLQRLKYQ